MSGADALLVALLVIWLAIAGIRVITWLLER